MTTPARMPLSADPREQPPVWRSVGLSAAVLAALALIFGIIVKPGEPDGCSTGLYPGTYADLLHPLHLGAFALLALLIRRAMPGALTTVALAACAALVAVSLVWPLPVALVGGVTMVLGIPIAAIMLVIAAIAIRRDRAAAGQISRGWLWASLLVGLPGIYASAYVNNAGFFCF